MPFAIRAVHGYGWVRELVGGGPIATADPVEAQRWPTRAEANRVVVMLNRRGDLVPLEVVEVNGPQRMRVERTPGVIGFARRKHGIYREEAVGRRKPSRSRAIPKQRRSGWG